MRNLDLDQYWPMPPRLPAQSPPVAARDAFDTRAPASAVAQPPLPLEFAGQHGEQDGSELIAAASAGWIDLPAGAPHGESLYADLQNESAPFESDGADDAELAADVLANTEFASAASATEPADVRADETPLPAKLREPPLVPKAALVSATAPRRRRDFTGLIWGCTGFAAGILAWHVVGFWSFVSNVVLNANGPRSDALESLIPHLAASPSTKAPEPVAMANNAATQPRARRVAFTAPFACVALSMDRQAGDTSLVKCDNSTGVMRDAGFNRRSDKLALQPRLQDPVAWGGMTALQVAPEPAAVTAVQPAEPASAKPVPTAWEPVHSQTEGAAPKAEAAPETGTLSDADLKLDLSQAGASVDTR